MAEGDTVHRAAARLGDALGGKRIREASSPNPRAGLEGAIEVLRGRRLQSVDARGKHLLLRFDGDLVLHSHLGMNGSWHVYERRSRWARPRGSAWAVLSAGSRHAVQFGGSTLELLGDADLRPHPRLAALGVDILAEEFTPRRGLESLRRAGPERELGDALLDQRLVAGIGNVYKSEGCFAARVSPWRRLGASSDEELTGVLTETATLMHEGVAGRRPERQVYRRAKLPCPACGAPIRARGQGDANRTTYWCGRCQG